MRTLALALCYALLATAAAAAADFVYVHNRHSSPSVFAFKLAKDGALTPVPGSPFALSGSGGNITADRNTLAYSARRKVLIAENASALANMRVAADGSLTPIVNLHRPLAVNLSGVALVKRDDHEYVYGASWSDNFLYGYELNADGSLSALPASPFAAGNSPQGVAGGRKSLFAVNTLGFSVSAYEVEPSGTLTPSAGGQVSTDQWPGTSPMLARDERTLYHSSTFDDVVVCLRKDKHSADLTLLALAPMPEGFAPTLGGFELSRKKLAVAYGKSAFGLSDLAFFRREKKDGFLAPLALRSSGVSNVASAVFDTTGSKLIVASTTTVRTFKVSASTGEITTLDTQPIAASYVTDILVVRR